jgi:hypothetical protein
MVGANAIAGFSGGENDVFTNETRVLVAVRRRGCRLRGRGNACAEQDQREQMKTRTTHRTPFAEIWTAARRSASLVAREFESRCNTTATAFSREAWTSKRTACPMRFAAASRTTKLPRQIILSTISRERACLLRSRRSRGESKSCAEAISASEYKARRYADLSPATPQPVGAKLAMTLNS